MIFKNVVVTSVFCKIIILIFIQFDLYAIISAKQLHNYVVVVDIIV